MSQFLAVTGVTGQPSLGHATSYGNEPRSLNRNLIALNHFEGRTRFLPGIVPGKGARFMDTYHKLTEARDRWSGWINDPQFNGPKFNPHQFLVTVVIAFLAICVLFLLIQAEPAFAAVTRLPGEDASDKLEAAGTLLKILDTGLFKWGARIFAGICIMSSAWALKEQRFGIAIICVVGALIFGTAPKWVKNIFDIGDNQSIFSNAHVIERFPVAFHFPRVVGVAVNA